MLILSLLQKNATPDGINILENTAQAIYQIHGFALSFVQLFTFFDNLNQLRSYILSNTQS